MRSGDWVRVLGEVRRKYCLAPFDTSWIGRAGVVLDDPKRGGYAYVWLEGDDVDKSILFDVRELAEVCE